jgi:hypothetical protein
MLWIAVLSTVLLRSPVAASTARRESRGFKTAAGEAAFMAAYDDAMKHWPVPYDEVDIPSRFGSTHVIACGPKDAPPLVLLHGYMATSVMWAPNVADFSSTSACMRSTSWGSRARPFPAIRFGPRSIT